MGSNCLLRCPGRMNLRQISVSPSFIAFLLFLSLVLNLVLSRNNQVTKEELYSLQQKFQSQKMALLQRISEVQTHLQGVANDAQNGNKEDQAKDLLEKVSGMKRSLIDGEDIGLKSLQDQCQAEDRQDRVVCGEAYLGAFHGQSHSDSWVTNTSDCSELARSSNLATLVTVLVNLEEAGGNNDPGRFLGRLSQDLREMGVKALIAAPKEIDMEERWDNLELVPSSDTTPGETWKIMVDRVTTPYVMVAYNLEILFGKWANLERSIRLLGNTRTVAVGGSTRNRTGHWDSNCWQGDVRYFELTMRKGYLTSSCDCMECTALWGHGPFVVRRETLADYLSSLPKEAMGNSRTMFLEWSLRATRIQGLKIRMCPDIMYLTGKSPPEPSREDWKRLASRLGVQGVSWALSRSSLSPRFDCDQVGLVCDVYRSSGRHELVPWCCTLGFVHVMSTFHQISVDLGFHYELNSGTALGAVKLNNFIPWDIDADIYVQSHAIFDHFQPGQAGHTALEAAGITTSRHSKDNYNSIGSGYFNMWYRDMAFEVMGEWSNLSLFPIHGEAPRPTLIEVGRGVWLKGPYNPGLYSRGRYGEQYLRHAQSWRAVPTMKDSGDLYYEHTLGGWQRCADLGSFACLERYDTDGNMDLIPEVYPAFQ